ncbi:MAG TPA: polysaccharide biosynthesis/export family protein [Gemmataceae bacterium]|jgi:protein involved in polysaccharide export with SLBB domain|nr:polysaccharide biosynthesis/export family protein [Gemmataceae bacterium]
MKAKSGAILLPLLAGLALASSGCLNSGPLLQPWSRNGELESAPVRLRASAPVDAPPREPMESVAEVPTEKLKVTLPAYVIEIPDVVVVDVIRGIPKSTVLQPGDTLVIQCPQASKEEPIQGVYPINPDGTVMLGFGYGFVYVANTTLDQAREVIRRHLNSTLPKAQPSVSLAQSNLTQHMRREHSVRPDGTISLGPFGSVYVVGLTLDEAKQAIEQQLSKKLSKPEVSVDVSSTKSKFYYVVLNGPGLGERVIRIPATGNETVLDAMSEINGLPDSYALKIWVARPAPPHSSRHDQTLPVDWNAVTQAGNTTTNYQLLPGDRVFVTVASASTSLTAASAPSLESATPVSYKPRR